MGRVCALLGFGERPLWVGGGLRGYLHRASEVDEGSAYERGFGVSSGWFLFSIK